MIVHICDRCKKTVKAVTPLEERYATKKVKEICDDCYTKANVYCRGVLDKHWNAQTVEIKTWLDAGVAIEAESSATA